MTACDMDGCNNPGAAVVRDQFEEDVLLVCSQCAEKLTTRYGWTLLGTQRQAARPGPRVVWDGHQYRIVSDEQSRRPDTKLAAYAVTVDGYGDLDVTVYREPTDYHAPQQEQVTTSGPLDEGYDPDTVLADLGYERAGEWTLTDFGAVCDVEPR